MRKTLRTLAWTLAIVGGLIGLLHATVLDWWTMPGDEPAATIAALPNLDPGDRVLLLRSSPGPGDLVRCADPDEPRRFVVGRIVAIANETVEVRGEDFSVDGKSPSSEGSCPQPVVSVEVNGTTAELSCSTEAFRGRKYRRLKRPNAPTSPITKSVKVPEGSVYLVSDDRTFPLDSREYGPVVASTCGEQIFFRVSSAAGLGDSAHRFTFIQ